VAAPPAPLTLPRFLFTGRFLQLIRHLPNFARLYWRLFRDRRVSTASSAAAARCGLPQYGELVEYEFPKERLSYGPQQMEALRKMLER
jgi:hypothetical protein